MDNILDAGRYSQIVQLPDQPPMAKVNRIGESRLALPTLLSVPGSYAFRNAGPGMVWDTWLQRLVEPNADE